jgi:hypothetical protein
MRQPRSQRAEPSASQQGSAQLSAGARAMHSHSRRDSLASHGRERGDCVCDAGLLVDYMHLAEKDMTQCLRHDVAG